METFAKKVKLNMKTSKRKEEVFMIHSPFFLCIL